MEYQKIINSLDNTTNQPSKFRTRNWVEINGKSRRAYNDDDDNNNNNNNNNSNNNHDDNNDDVNLDDDNNNNNNDNMCMVGIQVGLAIIHG